MIHASARKPIVTGSAAEFVPPRRSLKRMREAVQGCRECLLYRHATQAVFSEGPVQAGMMFVGEQPERNIPPLQIWLR